MSKFIRTAAVAMALTLVLAALAACGIGNDPKKAVQALEDKQYDVDAVIGNNDLDAQAELDSMSDEMHITAGDLVALVAATKGEVGDDRVADFVYLYYFKDGKVANTFWDANSEQLNELKEEYKDYKDFTLKKEGSVVYFGTAKAIGDCK